MKPTHIISKLLFSFLLIFTSCQKDFIDSGEITQQEIIPDTFSEYFGNEISRDFLGTVIDKNHNPIEGASITIGNETVLTDSNGIFIIRNANVKERFGYVKAEKTGYIHASRSVVPSDGTNKVTIMMLEATVVGSITSGSPGTVTTTDGSSVSFDGNFIKEDGTVYDGSVDVIMHHLDPTDEDMSMQMPGMLYAQNENGAERMLQTLGMLAVELRGSDGEDLNLAEGSTSEIKIPVDPSLLAMAPVTIPLWYFDEVNGYWKEEGEATLQGDMYVGTVSHFSFWNCDIPAEAIMLCVTVTNEDGAYLNNLNVTITSSIYGTRNGYTNERGEACGLVPSNESLEFNVNVTDSCGYQLLHTETIAPFYSDSSITIIILDYSDMIQETVSGSFNTCDGNAVTEGYVQITHAGQNYLDAVTNGDFEVNFLRCSNDSNNTIEIRGIDFLNSQTTETTNYSLTSPSTNVGIISACISQDEFIYYTVDDFEEVFFTDNIHVTFGPERFIILRLIENSSTAKFLADLPSQTGNYSVESTNTNIFNFAYQENNYYNYIYYNQENIDIEVTYVGNSIGDYIDINFSGNFINNGITRNISGAAHVRIDQ